MGVLKGKRTHVFIIPKRKVSPEEGITHPKSIIRSVRKEPAPVRDPPQVSTTSQRNNPLYSSAVKFFSGFTSSHIIRKKFGSQRILQELQRNTQDNETYGGFFSKQDNWSVIPVPEMCPDSSLSETTPLTFQPECLLGVGGQGCVFLGKFDVRIEKSYAFKIRLRTKSAINSGTTSSPGRRRSPNFRLVEGRMQEDGHQEADNEEADNFIDDMQQESLHREAVAAFRVHAVSATNPRPILYGYSAKMDYEVFVMEIMDFTLSDFVRGTNWKTRMDCISSTWTVVKDAFDACHSAGVVHYDIKPENVGIRITNGKLETGLLDFGISKTIGCSLERYRKGAALYRPPGTVTYMSPRSQLWKPMSWMDDFLSSFFTMYGYATSEGKSSYEKIPGVKKYKAAITIEERKTMNPESLAVHALRYPPWTRFPYGNSHPNKKRQNETIVKEEISLAMIKIHSIANPRTFDDIVSILINIDGFLDDTMDLRVFASEEDRQQFSSVAAGTLQALLTKSFNKFQLWWLDFAEEVRRLTDEFLAKTPEEKREASYNRIIKMLEDFLPGAEDVKALIEHSSYGRQLIETDF
jgi:serine/threonine protein kinase